MTATLRRALTATAAATALAACATAQDAAPAAVSAGTFPTDIHERAPHDEIVYFVLADRFADGDPTNNTGGIDGGKYDHGYDPTHKGFYLGGDLKGLTERLDYIQDLGVTAIWFAPIFQNQAVQGEPGDPTTSAGYHGYWVTDFLRPDAHFGSREEFRAFVEAAHARGMKVYMDIITNHTADVIKNAECLDQFCDYRSIGDYPWTRRGGLDGEPINDGFMGDEPAHMTDENFDKLTDPTWAYTPVTPDGKEDLKNPEWLNDPIYYSNRGETTWDGEDSIYGDFAGLDDLNTRHPEVIRGMIDIYKSWITDFRIDGFRVDTVKHVHPEFWAEFSPAIMEHAAEQGIEHFHMFAEVYEFDPAHLAFWVTEAKVPAVLDFAFQRGVQSVVADGEPGRTFERVITADAAYGPGDDVTRMTPTFLGNHDMGRFAGFVRAANPDADDEEMFKRVRLGHGLMMFSRGVPVIYYGDEQGFVSDGNDQDARETLFPSQVDVYNDNDLISTDKTTADENFDTDHPLYLAIAEMAAARKAHPTLRSGSHVPRYSETDDGLIVFSRIDEAAGVEIVAAFNADPDAHTLNVPVDGRSASWATIMGTCKADANATSSYTVEVPPLDFIVCKSTWR